MEVQVADAAADDVATQPMPPSQSVGEEASVISIVVIIWQDNDANAAAAANGGFVLVVAAAPLLPPLQFGRRRRRFPAPPDSMDVDGAVVVCAIHILGAFAIVVDIYGGPRPRHGHSHDSTRKE